MDLGDGQGHRPRARAGRALAGDRREVRAHRRARGAARAVRCRRRRDRRGVVRLRGQVRRARRGGAARGGYDIGWFRPITLWPFPGEALAAATRAARRVLVFELNAGQMLDDVRIHAHDRRAVRFVGGVSIAESGLSYGPLLDAPVIRRRILDAL
ncbi:hypothetical protein [Dactylosporangium darangshiense]|uniref:hypothetical protein n=1 Tax=Dactylosporangium darangshiense TaxID=579108 RepID=UPI003629DB79